MALLLSRVYARASGMPLLVALLVVTFALAADLAHEAWATAQSQQRTAERAARDWVRFAATSGAGEVQSALGLALRALFGNLSAIHPGRSSAAAAGPEALARAAARLRACRCAPTLPAISYFRLSLGTGELRLAGDTLTGAAERRSLHDTIAAHVRVVRRDDWDVALVIDAARGRLAAYAAPIAIPGDTLVYGLVAEIAALGDAIVVPVARRQSRAESPTRRRAGYQSLMRVFVIAPDGGTLYDANPPHVEQRVTMMPAAGHETYVPGVAAVDPVVLVADTASLGAQFGDMALDVALVSREPSALMSGEVPRSRLFVLLGLLFLMAGLVAAAVLQLRREHELARLRADLTAGVSHELRTPLAQIMLYGETLMFDRTRSERERRAAAEVIVREARRLMHLVENALHFARADRQVLLLSRESTKLGELTRDILVSFAPLAWAAQVTFRERIDGEAFAVIDANAYRQILLNLLENAVRYGPAGQTVTVGIERVEDVVRLFVEDQGPGVDAADCERIWAPFVRLRLSRQGPIGTGIGLAVVRDLTVRHGGRAWVERAEGGGARFIVELPGGGTTRKDSGQGHRTAAGRIAL